MPTVFIAEDPLDLDKWETHEVKDVRDFLMEYWPSWPETARIYHKTVSQDNDVTPASEADCERLGNLEGPFFVVVYPAGPVAIVVAVVIAVVAAVVFLLQPKIPTPAVRIPNQGNRQDNSPNNQLSDRQNSPRVGGRIPDIFGQVRSTPDLIAVPYRIYDNHQEVEISYMCIGRGAYDVSSIKDGETLVSEIAGTTVEIYAPNTSPNSGDAPQLRIGSAIDEDVVKVAELNSVNGQTLRAPNADSVAGAANIRFVAPDTIRIANDADIDFTEYFASSDTLIISNATYSGDVYPFTKTGISVRFTLAGEIVFNTGDPTEDFEAGDTLVLSNAARTDGSHPVDLAGTYTILSVSSTKITLDDPASVNSDWDVLDDWTGDQTGFAASNVGVSAGTRSGDLAGTYTVLSVSSTDIGLSNPAAVNTDWYKLDQLEDQRTPYGSPILETTGDKWIGPFFLDVEDLDQVFSNFVALNGLYKDNGTQQSRFDVTVEIELTPVDANGDPIGSAETFQGTIEGSSKLRDTRAITVKAEPTFTGRCKIRARRVTDSDLDFNGTVVDEIKWQKVYGISPITQTDFGNVTTVFAKTYATTGALSIKERKLNMLVTRKIPTRISGSTFTESLTATKNAAEILSFVCLDPYIGNRTVNEIDFTTIYDTVDEVISYFGDEVAGEFSYTFDNDNLSFEETVAAIAEAIYCTAYRQGNQIKLNLEKATDDSTLIFNHRNKIPGSETRTVTFGNTDNHDGVELEYVSPIDDVLETYYIPLNRSAVNPRKVETLGIRTKEQAFWHAWRVWNKIKYQNTATEFDATEEAALSIIRERILVADNTRPDTQDGEILEQTGLTLTLSQPVTLEDDVNYIIFLQHIDGTIESISITAGADSKHVVLANAPRAALSTDERNYARCTYIIVAEDNTRPQAFLVAEKDPKKSFTYSMTAINYSHLYYQQDNLILWLPFLGPNYDDKSPYAFTGTPAGGATTTTDTTRGYVHIGAAATDFVPFVDFTLSDSYTKMAWINKSDLTTNGHILSSKDTTHEAFLINSSGNLSAGHSGTFNAVEAAWEEDEWHHATVTYDADSTTMKLFLDGELVDSNDEVAQRTQDGLTAFGYNGGSGLIGKVDDLRLYGYALSENQIKEIYRISSLQNTENEEDGEIAILEDDSYVEV